MTFSELLKCFRKRKKWSQRVLANKLGVHYNTIWSWERGDYLPDTRGMVLELAGCLALDEEEITQLLEASLTALPAYWLVPHLRNPYFTGRAEMLHHLHALFKQNRAQLSSYALSGLGGIGKTQTALEYVYRHHHDYSAVFWITAETAETLFESFAGILSLLEVSVEKEREQQKIVERVMRWLNTRKEWLLVFDNVEDLPLVKQFLPTTRQGTLLFTSRLHSFESVAQPIEIQPFSLEEGVQLLSHRTRQQMQPTEHEQILPDDLQAAQTLVQELGGLPLALDQAGAYIEATGCSLADYLQLSQTAAQRLLDERAVAAQHPVSVSKTFRLTFERLESINPAALDVLTICSFLAPEAIPEAFFYHSELGPTIETLTSDLFQFQTALKCLLTYSLVQRNTTAKTLSIHRLVQVVRKDSLSKRDAANLSNPHLTGDE